VAVVNRGGGKSSGAGDAMRTAPMPGGVAVSAPAGVGPADSSGATVGRTAGSGLFSSSLTTSRSRGDNPITGFAAVRQPTLGPIWGGGDYVSFPFYGPWGGWYPWYTPGFGWYAGYIGYNPWNYAATCWSWGLWGPWYNPYSYCWGSYYFPPGYYGIDIGGGGAAKAEKTTGDLRVLASPKTAKVYIDGALVGTVDEFNGLNRHLEVETGHHVLSLKAEGYQSSVQDVVVEGGRTQTVRISLKKLK
jgi:hypothetical protein